MSTFYLIIILIGGNGQVAIDHIEFDNKVSCENARQLLINDVGDEKNSLTCVKK